MLQFILGRASSGKTYTVTEKIAQCVNNGENPVLLVPEQFSFESEKNILGLLGDSDAQKVTVISFSRLCDEIERIKGGVCSAAVSDTDRIILMGRAIRLCGSELKCFKKYGKSSSFAAVMADAIGEFKLNFVSVEDLRSAAEKSDDSQLKAKLFDTALIYEQYDAVLSEKFIDLSDRLTKLYYVLENYRYFDGKTVFVDSFKGFSGQQYKILERIISQAESVTVTLTDNPYDNRDFGLFSNVKKVKNKISSIARAHSVGIKDDLVLNTKNYASPDLDALEEFMSGNRVDYSEKCENITLCHAESIYSEADIVARNIRRIVREKSVRYSDFVIIARDTEPYEDALAIACKKNSVSCFIDRRIPLGSMPPAVAVIAASEAAKNLTTENILRFYKSGIGLLSFDEITTIENYTYLWNIDGDGWLRDFTMNPDGFSADEILSDETVKKIAAVNALRKKAIEPLCVLREKFFGTAKNMSRALVELLEECDAAKNFGALSGEYKTDGKIYQNSMRQSWEILMRVLNSLAVCFGEAEISKKEYCDALCTAVKYETVGTIPQMIDEVTFGAADRIRPSRPKYAFVVGANQGVFPKFEQNTGLFANTEREKMIALGIDISDKTLSSAIDEECLLYSNVCCASHGVFISYTDTFDGITAAGPSSFVNDIQKKFNCNTLDSTSALNLNSLPETAEDAFSVLCGSLSNRGSDKLTLIKALEKSDMNNRIDTVINNQTRTKYKIGSGAAKKLFGKKIVMSPSKFDTFNRCRFMYFCRYGLRAQHIQPAEFNAMQRGTMVHYVLQKAVEDHGKDLKLLTEPQISDLVEKYTAQYLDMITGYKDIETPHLKFLVYTVKRSLKYVVGRLALEFSQSDFTPVKCELKIGKGGDMPEIKIPVEDYGDLELTGVIDRIDNWNGYVRIIDYKTGHRDFKLPDILFGQNMQMLIYLYAVLKNSRFGKKPAGIFYMPASRAKDNTASKRRMNGLLAADMDVVTAMDRENKGEFIPKFSEKAPSDSYVNTDDFEKIFAFTESKIKSSGRLIFSGDIAADPIDGLDSPACKYCEYQGVCRIENEKRQAVPKLTNREVLEAIERQVEKDGI